MKINSVVVLKSSEEPEWVSCRSIRTNIQMALDLSASGRCTYLNYSLKMSEYEIFRLAETIKGLRPTLIIFIDHLPHPVRLIRKLKVIGHSFGKVLYFLYGDFTLAPHEWKECIAINPRSAFVSASPAQLGLVNFFLSPSSHASSMSVPFPVDKFFTYRKGLREKARQNLGLRKKDFAFLYTGRISPEKNVILLTSEIAALMEKHPHVRFYLAGEFDDHGDIKFGKKTLSGSYQARFQKTLMDLPLRVRKRIHYLGHRSSRDLLELYNGCDAFASLSTYHDEDFGMSPLEALFTGLPCFLSSWGGYNSFKLKGNPSIVYQDVSVNEFGPQLEIAGLSEALEEVMAIARNADRKEISDRYQKAFSVEAVARQYKKLFDQKVPFRLGFNVSHHEYAKQFSLFLRGESLFPLASGNTLYKDMYSHYARHA